MFRGHLAITISTGSMTCSSWCWTSVESCLPTTVKLWVIKKRGRWCKSTDTSDSVSLSANFLPGSCWGAPWSASAISPVPFSAPLALPQVNQGVSCQPQPFWNVQFSSEWFYLLYLVKSSWPGCDSNVSHPHCFTLYRQEFASTPPHMVKISEFQLISCLYRSKGSHPEPIVQFF